LLTKQNKNRNPLAITFKFKSGHSILKLRRLCEFQKLTKATPNVINLRIMIISKTNRKIVVQCDYWKLGITVATR